MSIEVSTRPWELGRIVSDLLRAPFRPQTYRNLLYLVAMVPLGVLYLNLVVVGLTTGLGLLVVVVGAPILVLVLAALVWLAGFERLLVGTLLDVEVPRPPAVTDGSILARTKRLVTDRHTWKAVAYLLAEFVYGSFVFGLIRSFVATAGSLLLAPFYYTRAPVVVYGPVLPTGEFTLDVLFGWDSLLVGLTTTFGLGSWQVGTLPGALLVAFAGAILLLVTVQLFNGLAWAWGRFAATMLTAPRYWRRPEW